MATEVEEDSNIVWPLPEKDETIYEKDISWHDAIETLRAIASSNLDISSIPDLNNNVGNLHIVMWDCQRGSETVFKTRCLKEALVDELGDEVYDINEEFSADTWKRDEYGKEEECLNYNRSLRLLIRLLRAYEEWEREDAKMSFEQMRANPLPKINI